MAGGKKKGAKKGKKKGGGGGGQSSLLAEQEAFLKATAEQAQGASSLPSVAMHSSVRVEQVGSKEAGNEDKAMGMRNVGHVLKPGTDVMVCQGLVFNDRLLADERNSVLPSISLPDESSGWSEEQWSLVVLGKLFGEWREWKRAMREEKEKVGGDPHVSLGGRKGGAGLTYGEVWSVLFCDLSPRSSRAASVCPPHLYAKSVDLAEKFLGEVEVSLLADIPAYHPGMAWIPLPEGGTGRKEGDEEMVREMTREEIKAELVRLCLVVLFNSHGYHQHFVTKRNRGGGGEDGKQPGSGSVQGIFPKGAFFNHSCWPNCDFYILSSADGSMADQLHVRTLRPVAVGEELTISYIELLAPRPRRTLALQEKYGFQCACDRCNGVGEVAALKADLLLSGLRCREDGTECAGVLLTTETSNEDCLLVCNECGAKYDASVNMDVKGVFLEVQKATKAVTQQWQQAMATAEPREREMKIEAVLQAGVAALEKAQVVLHSSHFMCVLFLLRLAMIAKSSRATAPKSYAILQRLLQHASLILPPNHFLNSMLSLDMALAMHNMQQKDGVTKALKAGKELLTISRSRNIAANTIDQLTASW